jgi:hypothetical protein
MTWSLKIQNGDLTLGNASYGTVTGSSKLVQDLRCYLLERMGTDSAHPNYGSTLNGGRLPDGTEISGPIGQMNTEFIESDVTVEIRRIINQFQKEQLERARSDRQVYGKTTMNRGEVLLGVSSIQMEHSLDSLNVTLLLITGDDTNPSLDLTIV